MKFPILTKIKTKVEPFYSFLYTYATKRNIIVGFILIVLLNIFLISKYPTKLNVICFLTATFTSLKWIFAIITLSIVLINLLYLLSSKILVKTKN